MSITVSGGCHCGLVHFEADLPSADVEVLDCNCSICAMTGYLHLIVSESAFRLTDGKSETTSYRFGSGKARHIFCATCGIKSFYRHVAQKMRSEEHTSELQSLMRLSYAVFCLKKKTTTKTIEMYKQE